MTTSQIFIGTQIEYISLQVHPTQKAFSKAQWRETWFDVDVTVSAGGWHGSYRAQMQREDFDSFHAELRSLYNNVSGRAEFYTVDGWLHFEMQTDRVGHITVEGKADSRSDHVTFLQFRLPELDQSYLPPILEQLEQVLAQMPIAK